MITYSFINLKGGTGKTTISTNCAYAMATGGLKVLFIDNDKQGNASMFFHLKDEKITLADIFLNTKMDIKKAIYHSGIGSNNGFLDVIPANMTLLPLNMEHKNIKSSDKTFILKNALKTIQNDYDICIIDNPPDINFTVYNALVATNQVVVVSNPDNYAEAGAIEMDEQFASVLKDRQLYDPSYDENDPENNFVLRGILLNKYISGANCKLSKYNFFTTNIQLAATYETNKRLLESIKTGKSILEISPRCRFSREILQFVNELLFGMR